MDMTWVTDRIAVGGGIWNDENMEELVGHGVTHIIDMQIEFDDRPLAESYPVEVLFNPTDDDFLPKPFNPTLLMARIESSLSKKRLRDQETAFLKQLQAEQDTSERLLLNILPRPIAERLKQGERTIADQFENATVLFSDFVGFTKLSASIAPSELVGRLNEVFSAFDRLLGGVRHESFF